MTNRVVYTDLILTFIPADDIDGRGVTIQQLAKLCINLTKQAFDLLGSTYTLDEDTYVDSQACFAIIQAAASRIANDLNQFVKRQSPYAPSFLFTDEERIRILELPQIEIDFIDGY